MRVLCIAITILAVSCASADQADTSIPSGNISTVPEYSATDADPDGRYAFGARFQVQWLNDGNVVVEEQDAVHLLDSTLHYLRQIVHPGQGPGEVNSLNGLASCGDTIVVHDWAGDRETAVTEGGEVVRDGKTGLPRVFRQELLGCYLGAPVVWYNDRGRATGTVRDTLHLIRLHPDFTPRDTLLKGLAEQRAGGLFIPYGASSFVSVSPREIVVADNANGRIVRLTPAGVDTFTANLERAAVPRGAYDSARAAQLAEVPASMTHLAASLRRDWNEVQLPDSQPMFAWMLSEGDGRAWLSEYRAGQPPRFWTVVDTQGQAIARIRVPDHFDVRDVRRDQILGILEHEDGSRSIQVRRVEWPH